MRRKIAPAMIAIIHATPIPTPTPTLTPLLFDLLARAVTVAVETVPDCPEAEGADVLLDDFGNAEDVTVTVAAEDDNVAFDAGGKRSKPSWIVSPALGCCRQPWFIALTSKTANFSFMHLAPKVSSSHHFDIQFTSVFADGTISRQSMQARAFFEKAPFSSLQY